MAISSISSGSSSTFGVNLTRLSETADSNSQTASPPVTAVAPAPTDSTTSTSQAAPAGRPAGGAPIGVPAASSDEDTTEAALAAALARAQALVGATEAQNIVNDDGSINYAELNKILAEMQAKLPVQEPSTLIDIFA